MVFAFYYTLVNVVIRIIKKHWYFFKFASTILFACAGVNATEYSWFSRENLKEVGGIDLSYNASWSSHYVWRGESQSSKDMSPAIGADIRNPDKSIGRHELCSEGGKINRKHKQTCCLEVHKELELLFGLTE